jgi:hypothetical protein
MRPSRIVFIRPCGILSDDLPSNVGGIAALKKKSVQRLFAKRMGTNTSGMPDLSVMRLTTVFNLVLDRTVGLHGCGYCIPVQALGVQRAADAIGTVSFAPQQNNLLDHKLAVVQIVKPAAFSQGGINDFRRISALRKLPGDFGTAVVPTAQQPQRRS